MNSGLTGALTSAPLRTKVKDSGILLERSLTVPSNGVSTHAYVVPFTGFLRWMEGEVAIAGTYNLSITLQKNATTGIGPLVINLVPNYGSRRYGYVAINVPVVAGDVIAFTVDNNGSTGSPSGMAASGTLRVGIGFTLK